jgi:hypothetical protein
VSLQGVSFPLLPLQPVSVCKTQQFLPTHDPPNITLFPPNNDALLLCVRRYFTVR